MTSPEATLYQLWREIVDLGQALGLLEWDQETQMPAAGSSGRSSALGTLAALSHRATIAPALIDALATCAEIAEPDSLLAAQVASARRVVDRALRVPERLARELAEAKSRAFAVWQTARQNDDFSLFVPHLETLLALKREEASAIDSACPVYDVLLNDFETGATEAGLVPLFRDLRQQLVPLVEAVKGRPPVDEGVCRGTFPGREQVAFGKRMAAAFGFDFAAGRLDLSAHPFCIGLHPRDVRLTCRFEEDDFRSCLYGILHEAGHGLFEQGIPEPIRATPLADVHALGVHESQSRLWENHVGRSRGFLAWAAPHMRKALPGIEASADALWPALHTVVPSLVRVDADEATYNLHIIVRFDLERALFRGDLTVEDLPAAWNDAYEEIIGIRPPNDRDGVLQDVHWSHAIFGYFPTYTLGTMAAAQLAEAAERDLGDLEARYARGDFATLLGWLRENVHRHGARYGVDDAMKVATGAVLSADPLLRYLRTTTAAVYGL